MDSSFSHQAIGPSVLFVRAAGSGAQRRHRWQPFLALATPLRPEQTAALDLFEACSFDDDLALRFVLQPGPTLVLHNGSVLHARTNYTDWPDFDRRRHLLRMWIDAPEFFPVHPDHELGDLFGPPPVGLTPPGRTPKHSRPIPYLGDMPSQMAQRGSNVIRSALFTTQISI